MARMRRVPGLLCFLLGATLAAAADYEFRPAGWAIDARLVGAPETDTVITASPQGPVRATRYFVERSGERSFLVRFAYPMAMLPGEETGVYAKATAEMLKSRPGDVKLREKFFLGPFEGERLLIAQRRDRTLRDVRLVVI